MELSLETCHLIVKHAGNRADICSLSRVSRSFRMAAERALYNTLFMGKTSATILLCNTLSNNSRLANVVRALTVYLPEADSGSNSEDDNSIAPLLPDGYWDAVAGALRRTAGLLHLNIHINDGSDTAMAWIFHKCTFLLRTFHCDLQWDRHLISFLNQQINLVDLYIIDYNERFSSASIASTDIKEHEMTLDPIPSLQTLDQSALPRLTLLESTFTEAAVALVPTRPITHLKTSISHTMPESRTAEVSLLFQKLRLSRRRFRSLDISDTSNTPAFSMDLLPRIVNTTSTTRELRYLGTLVLPIDGHEVCQAPCSRPVLLINSLSWCFFRCLCPVVIKRLQFYGYLMRLPKIQCVELDVTEWEPAPMQPGAFRALASELRLYCHAIQRVIFALEFDRTVMSLVSNRWILDDEVNKDILWREV